jgi:hypothetical protein
MIILDCLTVTVPPVIFPRIQWNNNITYPVEHTLQDEILLPKNIIDNSRIKTFSSRTIRGDHKDKIDDFITRTQGEVLIIYDIRALKKYTGVIQKLTWSQLPKIKIDSYIWTIKGRLKTVDILNHNRYETNVEFLISAEEELLRTTAGKPWIWLSPQGAFV